VGFIEADHLGHPAKSHCNLAWYRSVAVTELDLRLYVVAGSTSGSSMRFQSPDGPPGHVVDALTRFCHQAVLCGSSASSARGHWGTCPLRLTTIYFFQCIL